MLEGGCRCSVFGVRIEVTTRTKKQDPNQMGWNVKSTASCLKWFEKKTWPAECAEEFPLGIRIRIRIAQSGGGRAS